MQHATLCKMFHGSQLEDILYILFPIFHILYEKHMKVNVVFKNTRMRSIIFILRQFGETREKTRSLLSSTLKFYFKNIIFTNTGFQLFRRHCIMLFKIRLVGRTQILTKYWLSNANYGLDSINSSIFL